MGELLGRHPIVLVSATVWLGLASALILKEAAGRPDLSFVALLLALAGVVAVNAARFVLWGIVYRRHAVSVTYPLGATIFPLILLVGHVFYGEPATARRVTASLMIMLGVTVLSASDRDTSPQPQVTT